MPGDDIELLHNIGIEENEQIISIEEQNVGARDNLCLGVLFANHRDDLPSQRDIVFWKDALDRIGSAGVLLAPNRVVRNPSLEMVYKETHVVQKFLHLLFVLES